MKPYRVLIVVAAFLMLLTAISIFCRTATACPTDFGGPTTFTAAPGDSQTQTWTVSGVFSAGSGDFAITAGADVFSVSPVISTSLASGTFTITFRPGPNSTGVFNGTLTCPCKKTIALVGNVSSDGVSNSLPSNVSFWITPNPVAANVNLISSGVRSADIGVYDLLGNQIASSKTTAWLWDASSIPTGSYFIRITGVSDRGEQFAIWRRIIVAR